MTNLEKLLAEVRELDGKATKGPWETNKVGSEIRITIQEKPLSQPIAEVFSPDVYLNAAFISRARTLLPKLAMIVEVVQALPCQSVCVPTDTELCPHCRLKKRAEEIAGE